MKSLVPKCPASKERLRTCSSDSGCDVQCEPLLDTQEDTLKERLKERLEERLEERTPHSNIRSAPHPHRN